MDLQAPVVFLRCFSGLTDPRRPNVRHRFTDILAVAILAVMCRADDWNEVALYGLANQQWLAGFLELPNGIPCEDTFSRLFARLNPDAFEKCFIGWTRALASTSGGRLLAVDGRGRSPVPARRCAAASRMAGTSKWCIWSVLGVDRMNWCWGNWR